MSRIGRKPIVVPKGVTAAVAAGFVEVKGPKGTLRRPMPSGVSVAQQGGLLQIERAAEDRLSRSAHGLTRALISNMVTGVTTGFERALEVNGVGYRAEVAGQKLTLTLGYSHPVVYELPKGVAAKVDKNRVLLSSIDKELLGETAATLRRFRSPDAYKAKGVKYAEETIKTKVGKTGAG